jgi:hypothetical protein
METIKRGLAMGSVREEETAPAAGLMNFVRTISAVIATSLVTTSWQNLAIIAHAKLANVVDPKGQFARSFPPGTTGQLIRELFNNLVTSQSLMLATNGLVVLIAVVYVAASIAIVRSGSGNRRAERGGTTPLGESIWKYRARSASSHFDHTVLGEMIARRWKEDRPNLGAYQANLRTSWERLIPVQPLDSVAKLGPVSWTRVRISRLD